MRAAKELGLFSTDRYFYHIAAVLVLIKLTITYCLPLTSDEAYFFLWGQYPDINYYDHPPITGWVMSLFGLLGHHIFFSRLFSVISGLIIAIGLYRVVRDGFGEPEKARLITLCFLTAPVNTCTVLITTDIPLMLFTALSGFTLHMALKRRSDGMVALSGALWGMAMLSKYFAVLLLAAVFIALVLQRERRWLRYLLVWGAGALPFGLFHLWASYQNCWTNVLFNVVSRNQNVSWEISGLVEFIVFQVYLATPWLLYYLVKNARTLVGAVRSAGNPFVYLFAVPVALLGVAALHHTGLHWTLAFYPFLFALLVHFPKAHIHRIGIFSLVFTFLHVAPALALLSLPVEWFKNTTFYPDVVLSKYGDEVYDKVIKRYGADVVPAANGYATSATMLYHSGRHFAVFLDDSKYGRHDDKLTDYRALDGRDIMVLWKQPIDADYSPYFNSVELSEIRLRHQTFYVAVGRIFHYAAYRDRFLKKTAADWYTCPDWLPRGKCYFKEMYFEDRPKPGIREPWKS